MSSSNEDEVDDNEEFHPDISTSKFRRKNLNLLEETDKRYKGKKVSSKQIFNDGDSDQSEILSDDLSGSAEESDEEQVDDNDSLQGSNDESEEANDDGSSQGSNDESEQEEESDDEENSKGGEDSDDDDDDDDDLDQSVDVSNPLLRDRRPNNGIETVSSTNVRAEIEKGNCVREQLKLWENLLEMRIKFNKCLANSNKLPQYDLYKNYESNVEFKTKCKDSKDKLAGLLNNLLQLQTSLLSKFPETKDILKKGKKRKADDEENKSDEDDPMDEEILSDTEDEMIENGNDNESEEPEESDSEQETKKPAKKKIKMSELENVIGKNHQAYTEYRNSVIQKWNDKTRIAAGVMSKGVNQPAVRQIEFALANKDKLLKKTRLKRSEYDVIGKSATSLDENDGRRTQEYDTEVYDDDDFYHQLLRELIEFKSADITDPIQLSKQWIQLQSMRSKMKRKIDTRATKGRRIRYDVHQKLVNFMAPISVFDTWTDHAKDELYSSLFGKKKSTTKEAAS